MLIDNIIPYERNARHNEKAIPAVANSIKEFGLRGQILLESRNNPVIVTGHTRVAACKSLGWTEIPDEHIAYCDDLTEDQIKAYRIADNKTGEIATWNISMLQHEVKNIRDVDMSKYGCSWKDKKPQFYGAEKLRTDTAYNLDLCWNECCNKNGIPKLQPCNVIPSDMVGFNYAKSMTDKDKQNKACHFFIDDYQFERLWSQPKNYIGMLRGFACVLTPDFSPYLDMPFPLQVYNIYRNRALGYYWQTQGLNVIPTVTWAYPDTYKYVFSGIPKYSTIALSTIGAASKEIALVEFKRGIPVMLKQLEPARILLYGNSLACMEDFSFGDAEVIRYTSGRFGGGKDG